MKKGFIYKTIALIMTAVIIAGALSSCKGPIKDEEAREILSELLAKEVVLIDLIYSDGFRTEKDPGDDVNKSYPIYYDVASDSPYKSCAELKTSLEGIYCKETLEAIYGYAFDGVDARDEDEGNSLVTLTGEARFADNTQTGLLQINVTCDSYPDMRTIIYPDTAVVIKSKSNLIKAEVDCSRDGGKTMNTKTVELKKIENRWYLITCTMAVEVG